MLLFYASRVSGAGVCRQGVPVAFYLCGFARLVWIVWVSDRSIAGVNDGGTFYELHLVFLPSALLLTGLKFTGDSSRAAISTSI